MADKLLDDAANGVAMPTEAFFEDAHIAMTIIPLDLAEANAFVDTHHRHHGRVVGHKFSIGASVGDEVVGVAIVGRPVARPLDDGLTLEVVRCCTDGTRNACSALYGAAWRATKALGFRKLITYTLASEGGASLRAAGWRIVGEVRGRSWNTPEQAARRYRSEAR